MGVDRQGVDRGDHAATRADGRGTEEVPGGDA